jgi:hypothetical protein
LCQCSGAIIRSGTCFLQFLETSVMKEKIYNPASTNETAPAAGMAAVNTFNSEEIDDDRNTAESIPKNFEKDTDRRQHDDQENENNR